MRYILVAVGVALLVGATTALGGSNRIAQNHVRLGITNGVIHACVETGGNHATIGDIKLNHCHKGFKAISWNVRGPKGARGASTPGPQGKQGPQGAAGSKGDKGDKGDKAPTMLRLTGDFEGTNASVATSLDGVTFGPYSNGGAWGGSVIYHGADGHTLTSLTQLSYTVMSSAASPNPNPIGAPYLRIFLAGGHDVIFDATQCATAVPDEDVFRTYEVVGSNVRYDDDGCDGVPPDQQPWATVVADHGTEVIEGIGVTTGFTGGTDLTAILRKLSVNGTPFVFGQA
jgi:hypothetical protein